MVKVCPDCDGIARIAAILVAAGPINGKLAGILVLPNWLDPDANMPGRKHDRPHFHLFQTFEEYFPYGLGTKPIEVTWPVVHFKRERRVK